MDKPEKWTLTVAEAAERLGISRSSAYEAIKRGELPALPVGHRLLVPIEALKRLLAVEVGSESRKDMRNVTEPTP